MTILIVDDDPDYLELTDRYVKYAGYETILVQSGFDALDIIEQVPLEAIIVDAVMPDINGLDFIRKIKRINRTKDVPVVLVSALGEEINLMLEPESKADYYMAKPFSGKELQVVLNNLIHG